MSDAATQSSPPSVYLCVSDAADAIAFYAKAFGAEESFRLNTPDGSKIVHANMTLNGGQIMLSDDFPEWNGGQSRHPLALGATPVTIHLQVPDVDAAFARAVEAGCTVVMPLADQFWGDRYGKVKDPFGHEWSLATTKSTPSREEMEDAMKRFFGNCS
ncbi:VOC family protein [Azospirillum sp.]|uniref:VOC family protein n=1 Tax=Azospirillum sp. TaxID=34012 RepID=UPI002D31A467|nr:VOC family protein [Azospirillum sp.]HYD67750.1 VOC family protein [Azospirillum sp.]